MLPTVTVTNLVLITYTPSTNYTTRFSGPPRAIVIHTMGGTLEGTDSWFIQNAARSQVSSHYGVAQDGRIHQYVHLFDAAWANGILEPNNSWPFNQDINPNQLTISIETEDHKLATEPVSQAMFNSVLYCCQVAIKSYPSITHLMTHRSISPKSRPYCPGSRWTTYNLGILANLLKLELVL